VLLSGTYPYNADTVSLIFETIQVRQAEFPFKQWGNISDEAKELILKMLERKPKLRINFED
jgi:serine/threonine protein kinase